MTHAPPGRGIRPGQPSLGGVCPPFVPRHWEWRNAIHASGHGRGLILSQDRWDRPIGEELISRTRENRRSRRGWDTGTEQDVRCGPQHGRVTATSRNTRGS